MESNDIKDESAKQEENKKRYKMSLLYIQTKELQRLYNSEIDENSKFYYLIDKPWLDIYKNKNNYNISIEFFKYFKDWKDYSDFKQKIQKVFKLDEKTLTTFGNGDQINNLFNFSTQKQSINNCNLKYPQNCELIKEEFLSDCTNGNPGYNEYEVYIGNKLIIIKDCEQENVVFICSLVEDENYINDSLVEVNCLLAFNSGNFMNKEIEQIIKEKNIKNYFQEKKNIDIDKKGAYNINQLNKKIGTIYVLKDGGFC